MYIFLGEEKFLPTQYVLMTSKQTYANSPKLHEYIDKKVFDISTTGIFNKLMNHHLNHSIKCIVGTKNHLNIPSNIKAFTFTLYDIQRILYFFALFIIISSNTFLCEVLVSRYKSFLKPFISKTSWHNLIFFDIIYWYKKNKPTNYAIIEEFFVIEHNI